MNERLLLLVFGAIIIVVVVLLIVCKTGTSEKQGGAYTVPKVGVPKEMDIKDLQLFDVKQPPGPETEAQMKKQVRFSDKVYVREYGGPFGDGTIRSPVPPAMVGQPGAPENMLARERAHAIPGEDEGVGGVAQGIPLQIPPKFPPVYPKSSKGYGFPEPPNESNPPGKNGTIFTDMYDSAKEKTKSINGVNYNVMDSVTCSAEVQHSMMGMILDTCDSFCTHDNQCIGFNYDFSNGTCLTYSSCPELTKATTESQLFVKSKPRQRMV